MAVTSKFFKTKNKISLIFYSQNKVNTIISKNVYEVVFFGSENTANVGCKFMQHYDEKCAQNNSVKQMKKKAYREAVEAVEFQKKHNEKLQFGRETPVENTDQDLDLVNDTSLEDLGAIQAQTKIRVKVENEDLKSPQQGCQNNLLSKTQSVNPVNKDGANHKNKQLALQFHLLDLTYSIQKSITLEKSSLNLDHALSSMEDLQTKLVEASKFILLKYPQIVESQMSLCDYIGNTVGQGCWEMKKNETERFVVKAQLIRELAKVNAQIIEVN